MTLILNRNIDATPVNRRSFLEKLLVGAGVFSSAAIVGTVGTVIAKDVGTGASTGGNSPAGHEGMVMATPAETTTETTATELSSAEMDAAHKKGVEDFLRNQKTPITKGKGNQPLAFTMD